jgi:hypothetical protein
MPDDETVSETPDQEPAEPETPTAQLPKKGRRSRGQEESTADAEATAGVPEPAPPKEAAAAPRHPEHHPEKKVSSSSAQAMRFNLKPRKRR